MGIQMCTTSGGTQIWFGQGSVAGALKPSPIFKGHFDRRRYFLPPPLEIYI